MCMKLLMSMPYPISFLGSVASACDVPLEKSPKHYADSILHVLMGNII